MSEFLIFVFAVFFGVTTSVWLESVLLKRPDHVAEKGNGFIKIGAVLAFVCVLVFCLLFDWWSILIASCLMVWMLLSIGKNNVKTKTPTGFFTNNSEPKNRRVGKITGRVLSEKPTADKPIGAKPAAISCEDLTNLYAELAALEKFKGLADIDVEALKIRKEADDYAREKRAKAENIILAEANAIAKKIISDAEAKAAAIVLAKTIPITSPQKASKKPARNSSSIFRARNIDTVTFDYINAEGEYSSRQVRVNMVGQWEFGGIDLSKRETRTFKFERVVDDIVSEVSGEIIDPETWAEDLQIRKIKR